MMGIHLGCLYLYDTDAITHQIYYNYRSQPVIMHATNKSPYFFFLLFFLFQRSLLRRKLRGKKKKKFNRTKIRGKKIKGAETKISLTLSLSISSTDFFLCVSCFCQ